MTRPEIETIRGALNRLTAPGSLPVRESGFAALDSLGAYIEQLGDISEKLYWFYKMVESGGPDGTDLDYAVSDDATEAANRYRALSQTKDDE